MNVHLPSDKLRYEVENLLRVFLPDVEPEEDGDKGDSLTVSLEEGEDGTRCALALTLDGRRYDEREPCGADDAETERAVCRALYRALSAATGKTPPWGILTGVRPVKLLHELLREGNTPEQADRILARERLVSEEKRALCLRTAREQTGILSQASPELVSLYVAIPFCPSRCSYCTFVSHSVESAAKLIPDYVDRLCEEIAVTGEILRERGKKLATVYIGGGTPTALSTPQLERILGAIRGAFDLPAGMEYTVEAGRPDTITGEKLFLLMENGVTRVSINPQTLNDRVLERIGRRHTARQFFEAYDLARQFPLHINVDLIAGLSGDNLFSFRRSLDGVLRLEPENITVHTLTLKHGARLTREQDRELPSERSVTQMISGAQRTLDEAGYAPYYLYRQKGSVAALENVGFTLPDFACRYNVYIMEELHTIISVGAGGVTKIVPPAGRITRIFNYKYPYEYVGRFEEVLRRKETLSQALIGQ